MLGTPPYSWRVSAGVKPDGLTLLQDAGVATLQGTATISGTYTFTLEASDSSTPQQITTQEYTVITYDPFSITATTLKNAERTLSYNDIVTVSGGVSPYDYKVISGTLPLGLSLNSTNGVISGTTTAPASQSSTFTVRVTDSGEPPAYLDKEFSIFVTDPVPVVGLCGDSNGGVFATAPTTNLCKFGSPSASDAWNWNCVGQYGGATVGCSATFGYQVSVTIVGSGNVTSDAVATGVPSDISCNTGTCSAGYPSTNDVTLTATPSPTSTSSNWSGSCLSTPCIVTMSAPRAVTATFANADRARIVGGIGYSTLTAAITSASANNVIHTLATQLDGAITINKAITLIGGWNATFTGQSGMPTVLNGDVTVTSGNSRAETIDVSGKLTIQNGSLTVKGVKIK